MPAGNTGTARAPIRRPSSKAVERPHSGSVRDDNGKEAKQLVKRYQPAISAWIGNKSTSIIMSEIIHAKFTQNKDLRILLVNTYPQTLVEGNTWHDYFWGVCDGRGENWLGRILMAERVYWLDLMANKYPPA